MEPTLLSQLMSSWLLNVVNISAYLDVAIHSYCYFSKISQDTVPLFAECDSKLLKNDIDRLY